MPAQPTDDRITSEAELIALLAPLSEGAPGAFGLTDDCALLTPRPGCDLVLKTDPVRAGVHFFPDDPPDAIAWKALAVNVSDLAAKGATPTAYLMALSFPEAPQRAWITKFAGGLGVAQAEFGCTLIGGDTDRAPGPMSITITVIGEVPAGRMVRRGTARVGDAIYVSGTLGDAGLGLKLHAEAREGRHDLRNRWRLNERDARLLIARYLRPIPRLDLGCIVREFASAAMDLSDGLIKDLGRMCRASGVGARIEAAALPVSASLARMRAEDMPAFAAHVSVGDDYEILATVPVAEIEAMRAERQPDDNGFRRIGTVVAEPGVIVTAGDDTIVPFDHTGWDHF